MVPTEWKSLRLMVIKQYSESFAYKNSSLLHTFPLNSQHERVTTNITIFMVTTLYIGHAGSKSIIPHGMEHFTNEMLESGVDLRFRLILKYPREEFVSDGFGILHLPIASTLHV